MENCGGYILRHFQRPETENDEGYVEIITRSLLRPKVASIQKPKMSLESFESGLTSEPQSSLDSGRFSGRWWNISGPVYSFTDRKISQRLLMLTGSKLVNIFDPLYMKKLKLSLAEDFRKKQEERIRARKVEEVKRQRKELPALDKFSASADKAIKKHPFYKAMWKSRKTLARRESTFKRENSSLAEGSGSEVSSSRQTSYREIQETQEVVGKVCSPDADPENDLAKGFMMKDEELLLHKYEDRRIFEELLGKSVQELYDNAKKLIGPPKRNPE